VIRTYPDANVLIAVDRAKEPELSAALAILDDPNRTFVVSPLLALEVLPSAAAADHREFLKFWEAFVGNADRADDLGRIVESAFKVRVAEPSIGGLDAMHIAAAHISRCDELVTFERSKRAMHRTKLVRVVSLRA
jgi:predicted nucleic acid-binding protein